MLYWVSQNLVLMPPFSHRSPQFPHTSLFRSLFTQFWYPWPHMQKFPFCSYGDPGGPRTLKKNLLYLKIISTRVCKKIFLIRAKKRFVLGVPKFRTKTFIFEYFPKIPSEMSSTHPFYTILIPMTSHAKIFILFVGGPQGVPEPYKKFYDI